MHYVSAWAFSVSTLYTDSQLCLYWLCFVFLLYYVWWLNNILLLLLLMLLIQPDSLINQHNKAFWHFLSIFTSVLTLGYPFTLSYILSYCVSVIFPSTLPFTLMLLLLSFHPNIPPCCFFFPLLLSWKSVMGSDLALRYHGNSLIVSDLTSDPWSC